MKTYIIHVKGHTKSEEYAQTCLESCKENIEAELLIPYNQSVLLNQIYSQLNVICWEESDEGFRSTVYKDTELIDTIGYGFNLERGDAQKVLDAAGINKSVAKKSFSFLGEVLLEGHFYLIKNHSNKEMENLRRRIKKNSAH